VKWRFWEGADGSMRLAMVPALVFDTAQTDVDQGPAQGSFGINMPLLADWTVGDWTLGTNVAYSFLPTNGDSWSAFVSVVWNRFERFQPMAEISTEADPDLAAADWTFNVGFDATLHERLHALVSGGTAIHSERGDPLHWRFYVGLQLILGR
jgi:hypothetical protein